MIKPAILFAFAGFVASSAHSQDIWDDYSPWEHTLEGEVVLVMAEGDEDKGAEGFLGAATVTAGSTYVFESGLTLGVVGELGVQKDHPARAGFAGYGATPTQSETRLSPATGVALAPGVEHIGPRAQLEKAYLSIEGGYGELRIGRDGGLAKQFHVGPQSLLTTVTASNARLDPLGSLYVRTDHDLTGPAAKLSYTTPRLLGLKGGVSYTPKADVRGLDRDPARNVAGAAALNIEDTWEVALNGSRRLPKSGVRLEAGLAWSVSEVSSASAPEFGQMETVSAGLSLEKDGWRAGVDYIESDNGVGGTASKHKATSAGLSKRWKKVSAGAFYAEAEDKWLQIESDAFSLEFAYHATETVDFAISYQKTGGKLLNSALVQAFSPTKSGIVVEITRTF